MATTASLRAPTAPALARGLAVSICLFVVSGCASESQHIAQGKGLLESREYDRALADAQAALALDPQSVPALVAQALVFEAQGQREMAVNQVEKASAIDPDNATVKKLQAMFQEQGAQE